MTLLSVAPFTDGNVRFDNWYRKSSASLLVAFLLCFSRKLISSVDLLRSMCMGTLSMTAQIDESWSIREDVFLWWPFFCLITSWPCAAPLKKNLQRNYQNSSYTHVDFQFKIMSELIKKNQNVKIRHNKRC